MYRKLCQCVDELHWLFVVSCGIRNVSMRTWGQRYKSNVRRPRPREKQRYGVVRLHGHWKCGSRKWRTLRQYYAGQRPAALSMARDLNWHTCLLSKDQILQKCVRWLYVMRMLLKHSARQMCNVVLFSIVASQKNYSENILPNKWTKCQQEQ